MRGRDKGRGELSLSQPTFPSETRLRVGAGDSNLRHSLPKARCRKNEASARKLGLTCLMVMLDLPPLVGEGPEPALLLLRLLGAKEMDLVPGQRAQLQGILHADVEVPLLPVLQVHHLHVVHVQSTLVVQHVPSQKVLHGGWGTSHGHVRMEDIRVWRSGYFSQCNTFLRWF